MTSSAAAAGPKKGGKGRKSASFSGKPLIMGGIAEELEGYDLRVARQELEQDKSGSAHLTSVLLGDKMRSRPCKSTGDDSAYMTSTTSPGGSNSSELGDDEGHLEQDEPTISDAPLQKPSLPYPAVSVANSNRRLLGRRRISEEAQAAGEIKDESASFDGATLKRIPSSLFYFRYEPEENDDEFGGGDVTFAGRRRISRSNIPTSRKFSAASNYSFFEDEDDDDEDEEEEEEEKEMKGRPEVGAAEDRNLEEETLTEKKILSDSLKLPDTSTELYRQTIQQIDATTKVFRVSDDVYRQVKQLLSREMDNGLQRDVNHVATVKMYPTYVRSLPDGTESGRYLALDLGGTNFRVLLVHLRGHEPPDVTSKLYLIPTRIMLGSGTKLFDHIAECISEFLDELSLREQLLSSTEPLPLGFTFSFPCVQDGLASARLVRWTKGFKCSGVEGEDVVMLLQKAIKRKGGLNVECTAILNDNVGVLMTAAHTDTRCRVGIILGTGTNCCYVEDIDKVELWDGDKGEPKQVIINTEWGAFGDNGVLNFLRNSVDQRLDAESLNPGHQLFEKMISGMYMGELVRLLLCELTLKGLLFGGRGSDEMFERNRFYTKYISEIESDDPVGPLTNTKLVLEELNIDRFTRDDCRYVQHICWQVSQRAAYLAGTAVASVIDRLEPDHVTVAVDGSLYRFHPHFKDLMQNKISQLIEPNRKFKLVLANDGSGKGAALVAAANRNRRHKSDVTLAPPTSSSSSPEASTDISLFIR